MEKRVTKFVLKISPYSLPFLYTLVGTLFKDDIKILLSDFCETGKFICVLEKISIIICAIIIVTLFIFAISFFFDLFIAIYKNITNWYSAFRYPKITHRFELPNENDLRLYISNPKSARKVYVNCLYKRLRTMAEGDYLLAHRNELQLVQDKGRHPIFSGVLVPNDTREIKVGEPLQGKLSLLTDQSQVSGFLSGNYEYIISCEGKYLCKVFELYDFTIWLAIHNGVLIKIQEHL